MAEHKGGILNPPPRLLVEDNGASHPCGRAGADWGWFLSRLNTYLESGNPGWGCANCKPEPNRHYQLHQIRAEPKILTVTFCLIATSVTLRIINTEICVFWLKRRELLCLLYV